MHIDGDGASLDDARNSRDEVIDLCEVAYDDHGWRAYLTAFAEDAPDYLHAFGGRLCQLAGADREVYSAQLERDPRQAVETLIGGGGLAVDFGTLSLDLQSQGVGYQALHGGMWPVLDGSLNDHLAGQLAGDPVLHFWGGISLKNPSDAVAELRHCYQDLGAHGASIVPFMDRVDILDEDLKPFFAFAEDAARPLWVHCGNNFSTRQPVDSCNWRHLDRLASRHPNLRIIAGHGGWPWMAEMAAVAQRHRHVYLDSSTHPAAAMARPGYGWEPVLARAATTLRRKLVFGSTTWATGRSPRELADELDVLGLPERALQAWRSENARQLVPTGVEVTA